MLSYEQILQLQAGPATSLGSVSISTSAGYSDFVIPPHQLVRINATDGSKVKLCREHIYGASVGRNGAAPFEEFFASDNDAAVAASGLTNAWKKAGFTTNPVLARAGANGVDGELKIFQDNIAGKLTLVCGNGARGGQVIKARIAPAGRGLVFRIVHIDVDATKTMSYQIVERRRSDTNATKYWINASTSWSTTETDNTITGSATLATFNSLVVVSDETGEGDPDLGIGGQGGGGAVYEVVLKSTATYAAAQFSKIQDVGLHESVTATDYSEYVPIGESAYLYSPYWSRVGGISDNATKLLHVARMG